MADGVDFTLTGLDSLLGKLDEISDDLRRKGVEQRYGAPVTSLLIRQKPMRSAWTTRQPGAASPITLLFAGMADCLNRPGILAFASGFCMVRF